MKQIMVKRRKALENIIINSYGVIHCTFFTMLVGIGLSGKEIVSMLPFRRTDHVKTLARL